MRSDLLRRLERLEAQVNSTERVVAIWIDHRIDKSRRDALAENERIVCDIYREWGQYGSARERITTDPLDEGRHCPPGGYLEDVIRELHEQCEFRDRGCRTCHGLDHLLS